jgi:glycine cleavage system aminomethyltransferase T
MLSLKDNKPGRPLLLYEEPIYLGDKIIGRTTSGNYSFNYKKNMSFGYVSSIYSNEELSNMELYVEVAKQKFPALVEIIPLKDKQARFL